MKITILWVGKTDADYLNKGISEYVARIKNYYPLNMVEIADIRKGGVLPKEILKQQEGVQILSKIAPSDEVWLLDERGRTFESTEFAKFIEQKISSSGKNLFLIIGGAYGFSDAVYKRSQGMLSLSKMTFSHQMVRLFLVEQIYRAFSILHGSPYHH